MVYIAGYCLHFSFNTMYVIECELIYHEMIALSNLSKELIEQRHTYELAVTKELDAANCINGKRRS